MPPADHWQKHNNYQILLPQTGPLPLRMVSQSLFERESSASTFPEARADVVEILLKHIHGIDVISASANSTYTTTITFDTLIDLYLLVDRLNVPSLIARVQSRLRHSEIKQIGFRLNLFEAVQYLSHHSFLPAVLQSINISHLFYNTFLRGKSSSFSTIVLSLRTCYSYSC